MLLTDLGLWVIAVDLGGKHQQLLRSHAVGVGAESQGAAQLGSPRVGAALFLHPRTRARTHHTGHRPDRQCRLLLVVF